MQPPYAWLCFLSPGARSSNHYTRRVGREEDQRPGYPCAQDACEHLEATVDHRRNGEDVQQDHDAKEDRRCR